MSFPRLIRQWWHVSRLRRSVPPSLPTQPLRAGLSFGAPTALKGNRGREANASSDRRPPMEPRPRRLIRQCRHVSRLRRSVPPLTPTQPLRGWAKLPPHHAQKRRAMETGCNAPPALTGDQAHRDAASDRRSPMATRLRRLIRQSRHVSRLRRSVPRTIHPTQPLRAGLSSHPITRKSGARWGPRL